MTLPENDEKSVPSLGKAHALRPWSAPMLTVGSVNEVTRSGSTSSKNDGSSNFSPNS